MKLAFGMLFLLLPGFGEGQDDDWDTAAKNIVRLPPSAFPTLPTSVRSRLVELGCTIPQTYTSTAPHNVVQGRFASPSQIDWAVLCSRNGSSEILVFWGGKTRCPDLPAKGPDGGWLQGIGDDKIGFSRLLASIDRQRILAHHNAYGGPEPPPIDHHGIDEAFTGKASRTYYCYRGKWLVLQGAD